MSCICVVPYLVPRPGNEASVAPLCAPGSCIKWCLLSDNLQYILETSKACSLSLALLCYVMEVLIVSHGQVGLASYPDSFEWPGYEASVWPCETIEVYHLGFNMLKQQPSQATVLSGWGDTIIVVHLSYAAGQRPRRSVKLKAAKKEDQYTQDSIPPDWDSMFHPHFLFGFTSNACCPASLWIQSVSFLWGEPC